jgi:hypothetical protein
MARRAQPKQSAKMESARGSSQGQFNEKVLRSECNREKRQKACGCCEDEFHEKV